MRAPKGPLGPVNDALNRPKTRFGINYKVLLFSVMGSVLFFLLVSHLGALELLAAVLFCSWLVFRKDPQWPVLWLLSWRQRSYYDPGK